MTPLTKEQAIVISGYTGNLCCKFSEFHADVERRAGRPVFTHEFASDAGEAMVRALYTDDFMALIAEAVKANDA